MPICVRRGVRLGPGIAAISFALGCAKGPPGPTAESPPAQPQAADAPAAAPTVVVAAAPASATATAPEPAVEPEPPAGVTFPDGSIAVPCEASPPRMSCIPGGPFLRGTDGEPENARPQEKVWVHTFYMDRYEVTYAEYKACQKRKACPKSGPRYTDFDHPDMPIQGVSWFDAVAYCSAHGKQLPTEAQWEKAARGTEGALYPWGDDPVTCERAIYMNEAGRSCGLKKAISKPETGRPWDVGSRPAGVYGLFDMVGNSWEWVADWYARSYAECGDACRGIDPRGPCDGAPTCPGHNWKIVRGGSWYWDATRQTSVFRRAHVPSNEPFHHFGFRCAATPEQAAALSSAAEHDAATPAAPNDEGRDPR